MSSGLDRELVLFRQKRYQDAANELRKHLAKKPDNAYPHSLLAICLRNLGQMKSAYAEAAKGIELGPESAYSYYAMAFVELGRRQWWAAEAAARQAIKFEPEYAGYRAILASCLIAQRRYPQSLEQVEFGLKLQPDDPECLRLRAQALTALRQDKASKAAATEAVRAAPESPSAHVQLGWASLYGKDRRTAERAFREALRLDPNDVRAREGLLQSLQARFPPYAAYLALGRMPPGLRMIILLLIILIPQFSQIGAPYEHPEGLPASAPHSNCTPVTTALAVVFACITLLPLLGRGVLNVILACHPDGRLILKRHERTEASIILGFFATAALCGLGAIWRPYVGIAAFFAGVGALLLMLSVQLESSVRARRGFFWTLSSVLGIMVVVTLIATALGGSH